MKTTLILPDNLVTRLKRRAAERRQTLSEVVAEALRRGLDTPPTATIHDLPVHPMGRALVDVADRDALFRAMEDR